MEAKVNVTSLVAKHPLCRSYDRRRISKAKIKNSIKRHNKLLNDILRRLENSISRLLCYKEKDLQVKLGKWSRITARIDAICFRIQRDVVERIIVIEAKSYRQCGLCEELQLALYIMILAIKLGTTKISGLLVCKDIIKVIRYEDLFKQRLYEELTKVLIMLLSMFNSKEG